MQSELVNIVTDVLGLVADENGQVEKHDVLDAIDQVEREAAEAADRVIEPYLSNRYDQDGKS